MASNVDLESIDSFDNIRYEISTNRIKIIETFKIIENLHLHFSGL